MQNWSIEYKIINGYRLTLVIILVTNIKTLKPSKKNHYKKTVHYKYYNSYCNSCNSLILLTWAFTVSCLTLNWTQFSCSARVFSYSRINQQASPSLQQLRRKKDKCGWRCAARSYSAPCRASARPTTARLPAGARLAAPRATGTKTPTRAHSTPLGALASTPHDEMLDE